MVKSNKQTKIDQANMQSDALTSDGIQYTGDGSENFTYSFADLDDDFDMNTGTVSTGFTVDGLSFDNEEDLRKKYPALQDAWDHYKNVKHMCEQKEKENED
tara:strand:+ start:158 stop:460 length:303 start_codon:yes stop_codon:yes gene_type:complete